MDPFTAWLRTTRAMNQLTRTGIQAIETIAASHEVISARTSMVSGTSLAARAELARMVPEKVAAFTEAGQAVANECLTLHAACLAETERLVIAMSSQTLPTFEDAGRAAARIQSHALDLFESSTRLGDAGLGPFHTRATSNARRLRDR